MMKFLLASVGLVALGVAPAMAADMAARTYTKAPPMVAAIYDWSGFYIGANGGYGTSKSRWDATTQAGVGLGGEGSHDASGGVAGGQIGYRWQSSQWVFGLEAQYDWADLSGSNVSTFNAAFTNRTRIDSFGLFTGQVGYAWNNTLLYAKGGAGVVTNRFDTFSAAVTSTRINETRWGGAAGVGLEYGFAPNWSVGVEYDHVWLDTKRSNFYTAGGVFIGGDNIRQDLDLVTARLNYRWGGPVVAKY